MTLRVELVTTGSELLNGSVVNGHARWLGEKLHDVGASLARDTTIGDAEADILDAISGALSRVDVVIVTGGLGPTGDDCTRDAAARWSGSGVVMHEPTRQHVIEIYRARNKPLNDTVERHALVVEHAEVLKNHHGLAPGEHLQRGDKHLFLLPGPPREFQGVIADHVLPRLRALGGAEASPVCVLQTAGMGESDIASLLKQGGITEDVCDILYCARPAQVTIRLVQQRDRAAAFAAAVSRARELLGSSVYAEEDIPMEAALGRLLKETNRTLAVAESCTGGLIGALLTAIPGSSDYFLGGVISYANEVKQLLLNVDGETLRAYGAVSAETAEAMATGVRAATGADIGLSVTGIAGPSGGTPEKPVGLVYIGLADENGVKSRVFRFGGGRDTVRASAACLAMDCVRRRLLGIAG